MRSIRTKAFKELFVRLPTHIQKQATADYEVFKRNPGYPGLCFKRIVSQLPIYLSRREKPYPQEIREARSGGISKLRASQKA